jgi:cell division protein FtsA
LRHTAVLTLGGNHITKDIAFGLRIPFALAEETKRNGGSCVASEVREDEQVQIRGIGGRQPRSVPKRAVARIIEPRIEEILEQVRDELRTAGCHEEQLGGGLVLTGGCAVLPFIVEKARVGEPVKLFNAPDELSQPQYAAAVGLLQEAAEQRRHVMTRRRGSALGGISRWLKSFMHE